VRRRAAARLGHAARDTDSAPEPNPMAPLADCHADAAMPASPHGAHLPNSLSGTR